MSEKEKKEMPRTDAPEAQPVREETARAETEAETEVRPPVRTEEAWEALAAERDDYKDRYLRLAAEYDNYRKRTRRERDALHAEARAGAVEKFLPVYDNLERALAQSTEDEAYRRGVELTMKGMTDALAGVGVSVIEALGKPFDPALHDAVVHVSDDSGEENLVVEVLQTGFVMGDRVVRHSMVKVKN
ncbi:MAG: nucleotide exchange factor GrpE [Oscillospiraceae bacterium]|nr:nucleotide exchange factor GrpE [Oscillospiraceae bacterium]